MLLLLIVHVIIFVIMGFISALCGVTYDEDEFMAMVCPFIGIATTIYAIPTAIDDYTPPERMRSLCPRK